MVEGEAPESFPSPRTRSDAGRGESGLEAGVAKAGGGPAGTDMSGKEAAREVPMVEKAKPR